MKRYNGTRNDDVYGLAVDTSGNVVVTGNFGPLRYAAEDGALLWKKQTGGYAVAVDGRGNVVVTGGSNTAKYAAADGALLWEMRFDGLGEFGVGWWPPSLALGPDGMVAVTGSSNGGYATVVYRDVPAVSIDLISTGVRLRVSGLPGRSYNIERASAVTGLWSTINTQTAPASGAFAYLDTNPPTVAAFYRTREP